MSRYNPEYETSWSEGRYEVTAHIEIDLSFYIARSEGRLPMDTVDDPESDDKMLDTVYNELMSELETNGFFSTEYSIYVDDLEPEDEDDEDDGEGEE